MKYVRSFEKFEYVYEGIFSSINKINVHIICEKYGIKNYTVNPDGSIDVDGDVNLSSRGLDKLPLKFNKVSNNFWCQHNKLTTLEGCPKEVGNGFYCNNNKLTTLEGCPKKVGGNFSCRYNQLTTLEGCPKEVYGAFSCAYNQLTTLKGSPKEISGNFDCSYNELTTLEGGPKIVRGDFNCHHNELFNFEGSPDFVKGIFNCFNNPFYIIWDLFYDFEKLELLNDYDLLRVENGNGILIWDRLIDFLESNKRGLPTEYHIKEIKKYYEIR